MVRPEPPIIQRSFEGIAFKDRIRKLQNAAGASRHQLLGIVHNALVVMTENLLDAKAAASAGATVPTPLTEDDYVQLVNELVEAGMTEGELQALINQDSSHSDFCSASIAFMEGAIAMEGAAGETVHLESSQAMLAAVP